MNKKHLVIALEVLGFFLLVIPHITIRVLGWNLMMLGMLLVDNDWFDSVKVVYNYFYLVLYSLFLIFGYPIGVEFVSKIAPVFPYIVFDMAVGMMTYIIIMWVFIRFLYEGISLTVFFLEKKKEREVKIDPNPSDDSG